MEGITKDYKTKLETKEAEFDQLTVDYRRECEASTNLREQLKRLRQDLQDISDQVGRTFFWAITWFKWS